MTWGAISAQSLKGILGAVSPPVAALVLLLIQSPSFSLDPYFPVFLIVGLGTLAASIEQLYERKRSKAKAVWLLIGVALSGYVLVSWGDYLSVLAGFVLEAIVVIFVASPVLLARKRLASYGWKPRYIVYLVFLLPAVFPMLALPFSAQQPVVVVSPSISFPQAQQGHGLTDNLTIVSYYSDARDVRLTANSSSNIATYLDGVKGGLVDIPYLQQARQTVHMLAIEVSPHAKNGTYSIALNYQYSDSYGKASSGTQLVTLGVNTGNSSAGGLPLNNPLEILSLLALAIASIFFVIFEDGERRDEVPS